ncbi:MAG: carbohydrate ABC transporter permease [Oscillospiraceae bacterium]|nr:carbohydrate ABC transporter permease [Oscillospiraceae bacterium]
MASTTLNAHKSAAQLNADYHKKLKIQSTVIFVICIILAVICLVPIYILIVNATRTSTDITSNGISLIPGLALGDNLKKLTTQAEYKVSFNAFYGFRNSLIIAIGASALSVFFSGMTAYGLTVYDFKGRKAAFTFILAIMMVPVQVTSTGFLEFMVRIKLYDNYIPLIVPAIAAPAVVFFMKQYMESSFPLSIVEAARIDGCGEFRTFLQIGIPMLKPAFAVQSIFAFVTNWNNYYTPSMILLSNKIEQRTMPMMVAAILHNDKLSDYGVRYAVIAISIIPVVVVYLILSKYIIAGVALGGVKE